jgi:hypothetical protein
MQNASLFTTRTRPSAARSGAATAATAAARQLLGRLSSSTGSGILCLLLLCSCAALPTTLFLLAHSHATALSTPFAGGVRHLRAAYKGRVASSYGVTAGFWRLDVNYSTPHASLLARTRYGAANTSCWELAAAHAETYTAAYQPTQQPPPVSVMQPGHTGWRGGGGDECYEGGGTCSSRPPTPHTRSPTNTTHRSCRAAHRARCGSGRGA